MSANMAYIY